jgi:hypothetical protein
MEYPEMLADVKAYDAVKARLENGEDELIPLEMAERRLRGEARSVFGVSTGSLPKKSSRRSRRCREG